MIFFINFLQKSTKNTADKKTLYTKYSAGPFLL